MDIVKGDGTEILVRLEKIINEVTFNFVIDVNADIKAVLTTISGDKVISDIITINNNAAGTDLTNSLIIVEFTSLQTRAIEDIGRLPGNALLEIQVDDEKKFTWFVPVIIKNGNIP